MLGTVVVAQEQKAEQDSKLVLPMFKLRKEK